MLQSVDRRAGVLDVLAFRVYARPQQQQISVVAGETFGHPQQVCVDLARVVEGSKERGPDPLHVPEVKIFVSGYEKKSSVRGLIDEVVFTNGDARGIEMLHAAASRLWLDFNEECITLVRQLSEDSDRSVYDVLQVRNDLFLRH